MDNIRYLNLNISLFGRNLITKHLVKVSGITYIPLGRQLNYRIDSLAGKIFVDLPVLSVKNGILDTSDTDKIKIILNNIAEIASESSMVLYPSSGMNIDIISESSVIEFSTKFITLTDGKSPNQDIYRALIDASDQLLDHSPHIECSLIFSLESNDNMFVAKLPINLYVKYDNKQNIYFYSDKIVISYDLLTGIFKYKLSKKLNKELIDIHRMNFTSDKNPINIDLLAIEAYINYRSIIYN